MITGTARTQKSSEYYGPYAWGNFSGVWADAGADRVMESGDTVEIGVMDQGAWSYEWDPSGSLDDHEEAVTLAWPTTKTEYILEVTGENMCTATDTAVVYITIMPEDTARSSLDFVVNNGQIIDTDGAPRPDIGIYSHQASPMVYCSNNRFSIVHSKIDTVLSTPDTVSRFDINFLDTYRESEPLGMGLNPHHYNYYYPHCPDGLTLTPSYNRVVYPQLYENTDLHIKGNNSWMKFEFVIHPGGDPEDILMTFAGADNVEVIQSLGLLIVTSSIGTYIFPKPKALKIDTLGTVVELGWLPDWDLSVTGDTVRFANIGSYDPEETLVFRLGEALQETSAVTDIGNLVWCTHFGGNKNDAVSDIAMRGTRLFATGTTESYEMTFPIINAQEYPEHLLSGKYVVYVASIQQYGTRDWVTFYGAGFSSGLGIAVNSRDVYTVGGTTNAHPGETQTGFPWFPVVDNDIYPDTYIHENPNYIWGASSYATLIKMNKVNGVVEWSTCFGDDVEYSGAGASKIAINSEDQVFMVGNATKQTSNFPILRDASIPMAYQHGSNDESLGFIASFDDQNKLIWSTQFGSNLTYIEDVCIGGPDEDLFVTGLVHSNDHNSFEPALQSGTDQEIQSWGGGVYDAFVAQFDGQDFDLLWSTFLGGDGDDLGKAVNYNSVNNSLYVCGETDSDDFPIESNMNGSSINNATLNGVSDGFVTRYQFDGDMDWSTYFGGGGADVCNDIAVGRFGDVFFTGYTEGDGFQDEEMAGGYFQEYLENINGGGLDGDAFVVGLNTDDDLIWSTLFGGETYDEFGSISGTDKSNDGGTAIAVDWLDLFVAGYSQSDSHFPWCANLSSYEYAYYQPWNNSPHPQQQKHDGFFAQFSLANTPLTVREVDSNNDFALSVYPNPTDGSLNIVVCGIKGNLVIELYDAIGQLVMSEQFDVPFEGQTLTLSLEKLPKGLYVLTCSSASRQINSTKVIVN